MTHQARRRRPRHRLRSQGQASLGAALLTIVAILGSGALLALGYAQRDAITTEVQAQQPSLAANAAAGSSDGSDADAMPGAGMPAVGSAAEGAAGNQSAANGPITEEDVAAGMAFRKNMQQLPFGESEEVCRVGCWLKNFAKQAGLLVVSKDHQYAFEFGVREVGTALWQMVGMLPLGINALIDAIPGVSWRPLPVSSEARMMAENFGTIGGFKELGVFEGTLSLGNTLAPVVAHEYASIGSPNTLNGSWAIGAAFIDTLPWYSAFSKYGYTQKASPLAAAASGLKRGVGRTKSGARAGAAAAATPGKELVPYVERTAVPYVKPRGTVAPYVSPQTGLTLYGNPQRGIAPYSPQTGLAPYTRGPYPERARASLDQIPSLERELRKGMQLTAAWLRTQDLTRPRSELFQALRSSPIYHATAPKIGTKNWERIFTAAYNQVLGL